MYCETRDDRTAALYRMGSFPDWCHGTAVHLNSDEDSDDSDMRVYGFEIACHGSGRIDGAKAIAVVN